MARGDERFFLYSLADRLSMSVTELEKLPNREIEGWAVFLELEQFRTEAAERQAKTRGG